MRITAGIATLLLLTHSAWAQTEEKPVFVKAEQLDIASVLPNPPARGSAQMTEELAELHRMQDTRTGVQVEQARLDDAEESIFIYNGVLGEKFSREALPLTAQLSDHVHDNESVISNPAKAFFQRPRPYQLDSTIEPVCKTKVIPDSFPSGHATTGYLEAMVLTLIIPERRDDILARADDYAHNRLICGVHYASDIAASKSVAYAMIGLMMQNPQFRKELGAAKAETRRALHLSSK